LITRDLRDLGPAHPIAIENSNHSRWEYLE